MRELAGYKQQIDEALACFVDQIEQRYEQDYDDNSVVVFREYADQLLHGGKRIRGSLLMMAYEATGGEDTKVAMQAACAIEMLHTYILIIDDIQDRSPVRHNRPTVHVSLAQAYKDDHTGVSLALNAALIGMHEAMTLLSKLPIDPVLRGEVIAYVNQAMVATAHGQSGDILSEQNDAINYDGVLQIAALKTGRYTFQNPLVIGMLLAGKGNQDELVAPFARHAGILYQITDDLLGTFGSEEECGKSPMDDLREGKKTLLSVYALEHLNKKDAATFRALLGKRDMTKNEFAMAKQLIESSGAVVFARNQAVKEAHQTHEMLRPLQRIIGVEGVQNLEHLNDTILRRSR